jgi:four helix bundle protein
MAAIRRLEDLECCQACRQLAKAVYKLTRSDEFGKDFELVKQIRRSAISSMANIAEGFHRTGQKEFIRFLIYSRSSPAETLSHLYVALDQGYIEDFELSELKKQINIVWKRVNNLISYLRKHMCGQDSSTATN